MRIGCKGNNVIQWQRFLQSRGYKIADDGIFGSTTESATKSLQINNGLIPDGIVGNQTLQLMDQDVNSKSKTWPTQDYESMVKYYGPVGENQTSLLLPYKLKLAWDSSINIAKITCHEKVASSLYDIFEQTLNTYGQKNITELCLDSFGGCLNVRRMRGGASWSIHSWGAAVDLDPDNNQLKWNNKKAAFAKKEYEPFWSIVEKNGWVSLGRKKNYDWMHFQAARF
jgi:hypothetical protein